MKGLLPEPIRTRRDKLGFATAEEQWMKNLLRDQCAHRVKESLGYANGVLHPEVVDEVEAVLNGRRRFSQMPWRVICFGAWLKRFNMVLN